VLKNQYDWHLMDVLGINIGEEGNSVEGNYEKTLTFTAGNRLFKSTKND